MNTGKASLSFWPASFTRWGPASLPRSSASNASGMPSTHSLSNAFVTGCSRPKRIATPARPPRPLARPPEIPLSSGRSRGFAQELPPCPVSHMERSRRVVKHPANLAQVITLPLVPESQTLLMRPQPGNAYRDGGRCEGEDDRHPQWHGGRGCGQKHVALFDVGQWRSCLRADGHSPSPLAKAPRPRVCQRGVRPACDQCP